MNVKLSKELQVEYTNHNYSIIDIFNKVDITCLISEFLIGFSK